MHTHTQASDGMNRPSENVQLAFERGLNALAITDHDTVAGVEEALLAGQRHGIEVVPGVEISTMAGGKDIHILGYYVDIHDEVFLRRLAELRRTRELRNEKILASLRSSGSASRWMKSFEDWGGSLLPMRASADLISPMR